MVIFVSFLGRVADEAEKEGIFSTIYVICSLLFCIGSVILLIVFRFKLPCLKRVRVFLLNNIYIIPFISVSALFFNNEFKSKELYA